MKDGPGWSKPTLTLGNRLAKISAALRKRAANLNVPLTTAVTYMLESELPRSKRRSA
jgi:hypothetical protein